MRYVYAGQAFRSWILCMQPIKRVISCPDLTVVQMYQRLPKVRDEADDLQSFSGSIS